MLTNIGMGILLTACGNGGMDPVDTGGEEEYVPVRVCLLYTSDAADE